MYLIERTNKAFETVCVNSKVSKKILKNNAHGQSNSLTNCERFKIFLLTLLFTQTISKALFVLSIEYIFLNMNIQLHSS